jgi:hypothetical protein
LIRNCGWFAKTKSITKFLIQRLPSTETDSTSGAHNTAPSARCFECYELAEYDAIGFSRIINNYNRVCASGGASGGAANGGAASGAASADENKIQLQDMKGFEKYYKLSVICARCVSSRTAFKNAPRTYGDILADLLINDKLQVLADDLRGIGSSKLAELDNAIINELFNYNEKQIMLNHINKENESLRRNLDMEIEKNKILSEYKSKNRELQESLRNTLLQASIDLFRGHKKIIDEQIAKYNEYNNSSRYSVAECRICMQNEISTVLECGHVLCAGCHDKILAEKRAKIEANEEDNEESLHVEGYPCPFCKTLSSKFVRIYL